MHVRPAERAAGRGDARCDSADHGRHCPPPEPQAQGDLPALAETTAQESATNPPLFEELASEKNKSEQLHKQNLKLVNENLGLRQRIQNLQRQVNRLCDTLEMRAIQKDIRAQGEKIPFAAESPLAAATPENDAAARPTGEDRLAGGTEPSPDESRAVPDAEVGL